MGWKSRQTAALLNKAQNPVVTNNMVEYSINRYKNETPVYVAPAEPFRPAWMDIPRENLPAPASLRTTWTKKRCKEYLKEAQEKGYVIGAEICTKYGIFGVIAEYREIPAHGIEFAGYAVPNMFMIKRNGIDMSHLLYNEDELRVIQPQQKEVTNAS